MANYRTHVSFGAASGALAASIGLAIAPGAGWPDIALGAFFGFIGGMVPDLDHDKGHALQKITALLSTLFPVIALAVWVAQSGNWTVWSLLLLLPCHYLLHWALPQTKIFSSKKRNPWRTGFLSVLIASICAVPALFFFKQLPFPHLQTWLGMVGIALLIQLTVPLFKMTTVHRGVWHSVPVVIIYAELIYLFLNNFPHTERLLLSAAALIGCLSHLVLDEIYSVDFNGMRVKRSFGTALKFWDSKYPKTSTFAYLLLFATTAACFVAT